MVKILSSGEIVADDDPRAGGVPNRRPTNPSRPQQRQGFIRHDDQGQQQGMYGQQVSLFDTLNQKLLNLGIPRFNIGVYTVEPIVLVGFCLAGLLLGVKGLMFGAVLFAVAKMSTGTGFAGFGGGAGGQRPGGAGGGNGDGRGHTLGRL